jgi:hypothetical protein
VVLLTRQQQILGHPAPRQGCSLPLASLRDSLRPPLTWRGVPGWSLPAAGQVGACHLRAIQDGRLRLLAVNHGHSRHAHLRRCSIDEGSTTVRMGSSRHRPCRAQLADPIPSRGGLGRRGVRHRTGAEPDAHHSPTRPYGSVVYASLLGGEE